MYIYFIIWDKIKVYMYKTNRCLMTDTLVFRYEIIGDNSIILDINLNYRLKLKQIISYSYTVICNE